MADNKRYIVNIDPDHAMATIAIGLGITVGGIALAYSIWGGLIAIGCIVTAFGILMATFPHGVFARTVAEGTVPEDIEDDPPASGRHKATLL